MSYYKQIQGLDSTPSYNHHTLPFRGSTWRLGKRRNMPQGFSSNINGVTKGLKNKGKEKEIETEEEEGDEKENVPVQWESPP